MIEFLLSFVSLLVGIACLVFAISSQKKQQKTNMALLERMEQMLGKSTDEQQRIISQAKSIVANATLTGGLRGSISGTASLGPKPPDETP